MRLEISEVAAQKKNQQGDPYYPIKSGGKTYNLTGHTPAVGEIIEAEVRESHYTNNQGRPMTSRWATFKGLASVQQGTAGNGKTPMNQFVFAQALDFYWNTIKPFEMSDDAKASVLCTCLIATSDGRVPYELPPDEPEPFGD